jgi:hypothetical protein
VLSFQRQARAGIQIRRYRALAAPSLAALLASACSFTLRILARRASSHGEQFSRQERRRDMGQGTSKAAGFSPDSANVVHGIGPLIGVSGRSYAAKLQLWKANGPHLGLRETRTYLTFVRVDPRATFVVSRKCEVPSCKNENRRRRNLRQFIHILTLRSCFSC